MQNEPIPEADPPLTEVLTCQRCGSVVATAADLLTQPYDGVLKEAVFSYELELLEVESCWCYSATNPGDTRFDIVRLDFTLPDMENRVVCEPEFTEDYSWFPPHAWSMASCVRCRAHLGWGFAAPLKERGETEGGGGAATARPRDAAFLGLIVTKLRQRRLPPEALLPLLPPPEAVPEGQSMLQAALQLAVVVGGGGTGAAGAGPAGALGRLLARLQGGVEVDEALVEER